MQVGTGGLYRGIFDTGHGCVAGYQVVLCRCAPLLSFLLIMVSFVKICVLNPYCLSKVEQSNKICCFIARYLILEAMADEGVRQVLSSSFSPYSSELATELTLSSSTPSQLKTGTAQMSQISHFPNKPFSLKPTLNPPLTRSCSSLIQRADCGNLFQPLVSCSYNLYLYLCIVFVYLYLCTCICVFVFVYLYIMQQSDLAC